MLYMIPGNRRERSATALLPFYATCVYPVLRVWGYNSLMSCSELRGITYDRYAAAQMDPEDPAVLRGTSRHLPKLHRREPAEVTRPMSSKCLRGMR